MTIERADGRGVGLEGGGRAPGETRSEAALSGTRTEATNAGDAFDVADARERDRDVRKSNGVYIVFSAARTVGSLY